MRIGVIGSRSFIDYPLLKEVLDKATIGVKENIYIISGGAKGADSLAQKYANERGYKMTIFKPIWELYGKAAGPIRNQHIIDSSDLIIAFWDGESRGTKDALTKAYFSGKDTKVIKYLPT